MKSLRMAVVALAMLAVGVPAAQAQGKNGKQQGRKSSTAQVPPGHLPPAGMCRIWLDGVPPGRQPRATDCATARRDAPSNARVIYSDGTAWRSDHRVAGRRDDDRDRQSPAYKRDQGDDARRDDCKQRDRDGRCVNVSGPVTDDGRVTSTDGRRLPEMKNAAIRPLFGKTSDVKEWTPASTDRVRQFDSDGDGLPERAEFYGKDGGLVAVWYDRDENGRAERVEWYENGRVTRTYR